MSNNGYISQAQKLIQVFSGISSTEDLVIFVAGTDGMLACCQELIDQYDRNTQLPLIQDIGKLCVATGVLPGALFAEVRKVLLALNRFHDSGQDHYGVLGLQSNASVEEIKKTYRRLSKMYHPDRNLDAADGGKRFMEISGAYHALMINSGKRRTEGNVPWRKRIGHGPGMSHRKERKFFLILVIVLVVSLSCFSIYLSARYTRQAALSQLPSYTMAKEKRNSTTAPQPGEDTSGGATVENIDTAPATPDTLPPDGEQIPIDKAEQEAADQLYQLAPDPPRPPAPEPESEPDRTLAQAPATATATAAVKQVTAPEPAAPLQTISVNEALPAAAVRKEIRVASAGDKPAKKEERSPAAEESNDMRPTPDNPPAEQGDGSELIKGVINNYAEHYNKRELASFLNLFAESATENGQPVAKMGDQYRSLFDHTRAINMQIHDASWKQVEAGFLIRGRFNANYTYNDGRTKEHMGDISFSLVNDQGELKIQTLEYVFRE